MKVTLLAEGMSAARTGGTEIATGEITRVAKTMGHDVHVPAFNYHGNLYRRVASHIPLTVKGIRRRKPDLVHIQSVNLLPAGVLASRITGTPCLYYERGAIYLLGELQGIVYQTLLQQVNRIVAQTKHQQREIWRRTKRNADVIPNGVDQSRFGLTGQREARQQLGLPPRGQIALSVGRCRPEKNLENFILSANRDDTTYIVVGDGPQLPALKHLAGSRRVIFPGDVPHDTVPMYLCAANVLVNTSRSEGFPMAVIEGMASGIPVVASNVCGMPDIVEDGVNGLLTDPNDYRSTEQAISKVLGDTVMATRMGSCGKDKAKQYTWENVVKKLYVLAGR